MRSPAFRTYPPGLRLPRGHRGTRRRLLHSRRQGPQRRRYGPTIIEARARAYAAVEQIHFEGMHYRTDIALEAIELEDI